MRTRPRDWVWAAVAAVLAGAIVRGVVGMLRSLPDEVRGAGVGDLLVLVAFLVLYAVVARWLVMGAWRRTKWGAPPGGSREAAEARLAGREGREGSAVA